MDFDCKGKSIAEYRQQSERLRRMRGRKSIYFQEKKKNKFGRQIHKSSNERKINFSRSLGVSQPVSTFLIVFSLRCKS